MFLPKLTYNFLCAPHCLVGDHLWYVHYGFGVSGVLVGVLPTVQYSLLGILLKVLEQLEVK